MLSRGMLTYILPIRSAAPMDSELIEYLRRLARRVETIVVDGSPPEVFAANDVALLTALPDRVRHLPPAPELATEMGKVGGVLTGLRSASGENIIIADEDVRYEDAAL